MTSLSSSPTPPVDRQKSDARVQTGTDKEGKGGGRQHGGSGAGTSTGSADDGRSGLGGVEADMGLGWERGGLWRTGTVLVEVPMYGLCACTPCVAKR